MSLQLHVKSMTNNISLTIHCPNDITVCDLKHLIYDQNKDLLPCLFRLVYKSRELSNNEQFLNDIGLQNDDVLYFVMKLNPDREILLYLKDTLELNLNWSNELQFDQWEHIEVLDNKIIQLELYEYYLTFEIPTEIGKLNNLQELYLEENKLTGEIPTEIGKLTNLRGLRLNDNELTGKIPPEIGKLTNLELLQLSGNQLTSEIPTEIGKLSNLQELYLSINELTGNIPSEIGKLSNLEWLELYNNQLTGEIPTEIGKLNNLVWLDLLNNNLSKNIPKEVKKLICTIKN